MTLNYEIRNGVAYRDDGHRFCDRCGSSVIVADRCVRCDVTPTDADRALAAEIMGHCYRERQAAQPGLSDGRPEHFNSELAARIIAAARGSDL